MWVKLNQPRPFTSEFVSVEENMLWVLKFSLAFSPPYINCNLHYYSQKLNTYPLKIILGVLENLVQIEHLTKLVCSPSLFVYLVNHLLGVEKTWRKIVIQAQGTKTSCKLTFSKKSSYLNVLGILLSCS